MAAGLRQHGWEARTLAPWLPNLPFSLEAFLSIPRFALIALFSRADLALGIKPYPNCALALFILKAKGTRVCCDVDDLDWGWRKGLARWLAFAALRPAFSLLPLFSTHHPGIKRALQQQGLAQGDRILPLPQGVAPELFPKRPTPKNGPLLFVAHLNVACQLELLLEWLGPLLGKKGVPDLLVAGGGPLLRRWQSRHEGPHVHFSGPVSTGEAAVLMSRARVCLSAYAPGEGNEFRVPMKVLEYLAAGRAVLSNLIPGLEPLKRHLYACKPQGEDFRRVLLGLLKSGGDGREARGRALVLKSYSWKAAVASLLKSLP